jgi:hypothetical protein
LNILKCGYSGFSYKICEGNFETEIPVASLKFPTSGKNNFSAVTLFTLPQCQGNPLRITYSHDCFTDSSNRVQAYKSFAIEKVSKEGCIMLFRFTCNVGIPLFEVCSNISDFQQLNSSSNVSDILSMTFDFKTIESVTFYDSPNFVGKAYSISARDPILNVNADIELSSILKVTRSMMINKRTIN